MVQALDIKVDADDLTAVVDIKGRDGDGLRDIHGKDGAMAHR